MNINDLFLALNDASGLTMLDWMMVAVFVGVTLVCVFTTVPGNWWRGIIRGLLASVVLCTMLLVTVCMDLSLVPFSRVAILVAYALALDMIDERARKRFTVLETVSDAVSIITDPAVSRHLRTHYAKRLQELSWVAVEKALFRYTLVEQRQVRANVVEVMGYSPYPSIKNEADLTDTLLTMARHYEKFPIPEIESHCLYFNRYRAVAALYRTIR